MNNPNARTTKVLISGKWMNTLAINIKKGMVFKMFEPDGTPLIYSETDIFIATTDAYLNQEKIAVINIEPFSPPLS